MSDIEIIQAPRVMLSVEQAAKCLSVGRSTVYELIHSGEIESVHIGRLHRVPADCLHEFVERCRRQQSLGEP
ncbi:MAG: helix-turn-helix domain-containing protein [Dermatophilaceae bacterium]